MDGTAAVLSAAAFCCFALPLLLLARAAPAVVDLAAAITVIAQAVDGTAVASASVIAAVVCCFALPLLFLVRAFTAVVGNTAAAITVIADVVDGIAATSTSANAFVALLLILMKLLLLLLKKYSDSVSFVISNIIRTTNCSINMYN